MRDFQRQICCKISQFCEILGANFSKKRLVMTAKFLGIFWANSLEINLFCPDLMSVFKFFLIEIIISSFNNNALDKCANGKAVTSWLAVFNLEISQSGSYVPHGILIIESFRKWSGQVIELTSPASPTLSNPSSCFSG